MTSSKGVASMEVANGANIAACSCKKFNWNSLHAIGASPDWSIKPQCIYNIWVKNLKFKVFSKGNSWTSLQRIITKVIIFGHSNILNMPLAFLIFFSLVKENTYYIYHFSLSYLSFSGCKLAYGCPRIIFQITIHEPYLFCILSSLKKKKLLCVTYPVYHALPSKCVGDPKIHNNLTSSYILTPLNIKYPINNLNFSLFLSSYYISSSIISIGFGCLKIKSSN